MATKKTATATAAKQPPTSAATNPALKAALQKAVTSQAPAPDLLARIKAAATELYAAVQTQDKKEEEFKEAKARVLKLRTEGLPALLDEAQMQGLDLDDGIRIERDQEIYANISRANEQDAAAWLRNENLGSLIREEISIPIDKGDMEATDRIISILTEADIPFEERSGVHPATLKALVRERLEEGKVLPTSITYHVQPVVNVKQPKAKKATKTRQEN